MSIAGTQRRASGFTLIEVLLALALAVGLLGAMIGFQRHAADVREDVQARIGRVQARRGILDKLTRELRAALAYEFLDLGLEGEPGRMTFITATLPGDAAWAVRRATEDPIPPEQDLQLVTYELRTQEDEAGREIVVGLQCKTQKVIGAKQAEEGKEVAVRLLSPDVRFLWLRYHDGSDWVEQWQEGSLPRAVEVVLGEQPLPEGVEPAEYPHDTWRRTVALPGSAPARQTGNVVRGLGGTGL